MSIVLILNNNRLVDEYALLYYKHGTVSLRERELLKQLIDADTKGLTFTKMYLKGEGVFGKNRNGLLACLNKLVDDKKVWRDRVSHKNVRYKIAFDDLRVKEFLLNRRVELDGAFEGNKRYIREKSVAKNAELLHEFMIFSELAKFLEALEMWVRAEDKWKDDIYDFIKKYSLENFADLLVEGGCTNPNAMDKAIKSVMDYLNERVTKSGALFGVVVQSVKE